MLKKQKVNQGLVNPRQTNMKEIREDKSGSNKKSTPRPNKKKIVREQRVVVGELRNRWDGDGREHGGGGFEKSLAGVGGESLKLKFMVR